MIAFATGLIVGSLGAVFVLAIVGANDRGEVESELRAVRKQRDKLIARIERDAADAFRRTSDAAGRKVVS